MSKHLTELPTSLENTRVMLYNVIIIINDTMDR